MASILYVEDDVVVTRAMLSTLHREEWLIHVANDRVAGLRYAQERKYDIALLDCMLPGDADGLETCRLLRRVSPQTRVLLFSASSADRDIVAALEAGADEYIPKPCTPLVLTARIRAHLRRSEPPGPASSSTYSVTPGSLSYASLELDLLNQTLAVEGKVVVLTRYQFMMLAYMIAHRGRAISTEEFRARVFRSQHERFSSNVRRQVHALRQLLDNSRAGLSELIENVPGAGYGVGIRSRLNDPGA